MLFSSLTFLIYFLPSVVLIHLVLPHWAKNYFLFIASILFYAWGEIRYVPLILTSIFLNYWCGWFCGSNRLWIRRLSLTLSLLLNIGMLLYFKYAVFFMNVIGLGSMAPQVSLPLGISFYVFQVQSYNIDVARRTVPPERNVLYLGTYILLFPQLIAGPIVRYTDVCRELRQRRLNTEDLEAGMMKFTIGLSSKVLLADPLGEIWTTVQSMQSASSITLFISIIAYGLQIYFDFNGYSMMAVGIGKMLGFDFPENFHHPYASCSIKEFWQRWHITLGSWFRQYLYFPLCDVMGKRGRHFAAFVVWFCTGLWHGASWNFVAWGLWFFVLLMLERFILGKWMQKHRVFARCYTLFGVWIGWILFAHTSLENAWNFSLRLFSFQPGDDWMFVLGGNTVLLILATLCCIPKLMDSLWYWMQRHPVWRSAMLYVIFILSIATLLNADYSPFLYFRF